MTILEKEYWNEKYKKHRMLFTIVSFLIGVSLHYYFKESPKVIEYEQTLTVVFAEREDVKVWKDNYYWKVNYVHSWVDSVNTGDKIRCKVKYQEDESPYLVREQSIRYLYKVK